MYGPSNVATTNDCEWDLDVTSYFKALQNSLVTSDMSKWFGFCVKCDTTRPHCRRQFLHGRDTVSVRAATDCSKYCSNVAIDVMQKTALRH